MIFKLTSAAGSAIIKSIVRDTEAYKFLEEAVSQEKKDISLGILFCRELSGNLCSGVCSNGSSWGFTVYSKFGKYRDERRQAVDYKGVEYDIIHTTIKLNFFDLIVHHRYGLCGCNKYRVDVCLPEAWCAKISRLSKLRMGIPADYSPFETIKGILNERRSFNYQVLKGFREPDTVVH